MREAAGLYTSPLDPVLRTDLFVRWCAKPALAGEELLRDIRACSKALKACTGIAHMRGLELCAQACGLRSYHEARGVLDEAQGLASDDVAQLRVLLQRHAQAWMVLARPQLGRAPSPQQFHWMRGYAAALAACAGLSLEQALQVQAHRFGAVSWEALQDRESHLDAQPLFEWVPTGSASPGPGPWNARAQWSELGESLREQVLSWEQAWDDLHDVHGRHAGTILAKAQVLWEQHPTCLHAALLIAEARRQQGKVHQAAQVLDQALQTAQPRVWASEDVRISWYKIDNRVVLRLLKARVQTACELGHKDVARRLARVSLRLNPSDNLGMRFWLERLEGPARRSDEPAAEPAAEPADEPLLPHRGAWAG